MADTRKKNVDWIIPRNLGGDYNVEAASLAVLMDLRDELKEIKTLLGKYNVQDAHRILRQIRSNTSRIPKKAMEKQ